MHGVGQDGPGHAWPRLPWTDIAPGTAICMATPVHMVAGMASVHLHPAGMLALDRAEATDLQEDSSPNSEVIRSACILQAAELLLESSLAVAAGAPDPARLLGSPLEAVRTPDRAQAGTEATWSRSGDVADRIAAES